MTASDQTAHHQALRGWARGSYPLEAATELLIRAQHGRWASPDQMWVQVEPNGQAWIDFAELTAQLAAGGTWSGGERRILTVAAAIGDDDGLLADALPGLDRDNISLVLAAIAHAAGSHEHTPTPIIWGTDDAGEPRPVRNPDQAKLGPLYPWPNPPTPHPESDRPRPTSQDKP